MEKTCPVCQWRMQMKKFDYYFYCPVCKQVYKLKDFGLKIKGGVISAI
jgi:predicted RNA-binding Zn-ribbon protein involved in translation (DUF1610 family)